MSRRLVPVLLASLLLLAPSAATTLTASLSHPSTAAVGEPLLVTARVAASSLSSSQVSVSATLADNTGGAFTISSPTQTLTFTSNSTQTVTWSVTPVQAGTRSGAFTVTAKVDSGSSSDVPGTAISTGAVTVSARPVLDITCTADTATAGGVAVPVNCSLSNPSGRNVSNVQTCLAASGTTLTVNITSSLPTQVHTFNFNNVASLSLPNQKCYDVGTVGSVFALSWQVTGNAGGGNPSGNPAAAAGGGAAAAEEKVIRILDPLVGFLTLLIDDFQEHFLGLVSKGVQQILAFTKTFLTEITFTTVDSVDGVRLTAQQLAAKPKEVPDDPAGRAYRFFTVRTENINEANLKEATITFKVEKSALGGGSADQVRLQKYLRVGDGLGLAWRALPTWKTGEDEHYLYFRGVTPGFSIFAIAGEQVPDARVSLFAVTLPTGSGVVPLSSGPEVALPAPGSVPSGELLTGGLSSPPAVAGGLAAIAGAAAVAFLLLRRRRA
ncbi:MAG: PGF-pre-PGF domain-containing protein [Halobacteria archaeon]